MDGVDSTYQIVNRLIPDLVMTLFTGLAALAAYRRSRRRRRYGTLVWPLVTSLACFTLYYLINSLVDLTALSRVVGARVIIILVCLSIMYWGFSSRDDG